MSQTHILYYVNNDSPKDRAARAGDFSRLLLRDFASTVCWMLKEQKGVSKLLQQVGEIRPVFLIRIILTHQMAAPLLNIFGPGDGLMATGGLKQPNGQSREAI